MLSKAWAVLVAGGLVVSASGGRGQEGASVEGPMGAVPAPTGMDPALMGGDHPGEPCPTCAERRTIYNWLLNHCTRTKVVDDELCPKGHDWKGWLTYRSESRACCGWQPCCPPPLYTFFLDPHCGECAPSGHGVACAAPACGEAKEGKLLKGGHHWDKLLFWRHHAECPADGPAEAPAGAMAVAAPHP